MLFELASHARHNVVGLPGHHAGQADAQLAGAALEAHTCGVFTNLALPAGNPDDPVFVSAAYGAGALGLR
jgi:hypothetical protein